MSDLPQLVLIPGLLNDADLWRDQIAGLSDVARPVVADITRGETLSALASGVLAGAEGRFALAGFSLGGIVALEIMRIAPERVSHLALLDTTMLPDSPDRAQERRRLIATARNPGKFHGFGEHLLHTYLAPEHLGNTEMVERVRAMTARLGPEVFARQSLIDRPDSRATLARLRCPVLVLCGEHDALTPPELHREMAVAIPFSRLDIVPHAGHLTPIEQPQAVTSALLHLLRS
ncbi:pimeloyl-ACP methyl ester carboxylesterase [Pseudochelatococcus lubricantis]|uniref:Pimeloyl-ACP methyl ester carboxylesterase n=1 Tax=Pseudochelatococcus lubricantis TaxID=1538102 RepID=A0ABX0V0K2_9HYPH|nr:alpha/beta fold hydrolase [Pseudochelatococcus lubricantis]NIJ57624.1 pimeloyl-ACP methyl ester carboxylesterase [Pseudochelatococcus lubricantis]